MKTEIKFGTDGWRGVIAENFTFDNVLTVAQALSDYVNSSGGKKKKTLVVGYDTRFMSEKYAQLVAGVLAANKINVMISDKFLPTPALSLAAKNKSTHGGVMITASHNPAIFSGIKFKTKLGTSADREVTDAVEKHLGKKAVKKMDYRLAVDKGLIREADFIKTYITHLKKFVDMRLLNKSSISVAISAMYATADSLMQRILKNSKIKISYVGNEPRCDFNGIQPEPIESNLEHLRRLIKSGNYACGLATDGDSDRVGLMSEKGTFINSSKAFVMLLLYFMEKKNIRLSAGKTISCSDLIDRVAQAHDIKLTETPIGFKYLADLMLEGKIEAGCEESGGIGLADYLPERDGLLAQLLLLEMLAFYKKPVGEILNYIEKKYGKFYYQRADLEYAGSKKKRVMSVVSPAKMKKVISIGIKNVKTIDGTKYCLEDGSWLLFRFSGTEPILRIYAESDKKDKTSRIIKFAISKVKNELR